MRKSRLLRQLALVTFLVAVGAVALATAGFGRSAAKPANPGGRIVLSVGGRQIASFQELAHFTLETEPPGSYRYADKRQVVNTLPPQMIPPKIALKHGIDGDGTLWNWHQLARQGNVKSARRNVTLTVVNGDGQAIEKWLLENAWVQKLDISAFKAGTSEVVYDAVTLVSEYVQRETP